MNKKLIDIKKNFSEKIPKEKRYKILIAFGIIAIVLIGISDLFGKEEKTDKTELVPLSLETNEYKKAIESELTEVLKRIEGVGEVKVMLTIEGTTEYIYAEEIETESNISSDTKSDSYKNNFVIINKGNNNYEPLVKKVLKPKINGVVIVCEGGNSIQVVEKVYKAVSTVLGIPSSRVCVIKG